MSFYYLYTVLEIDLYIFVLDVCGSFFWEGSLAVKLQNQQVHLLPSSCFLNTIFYQKKPGFLTEMIIEPERESKK